MEPPGPPLPLAPPLTLTHPLPLFKEFSFFNVSPGKMVLKCDFFGCVFVLRPLTPQATPIKKAHFATFPKMHTGRGKMIWVTPPPLSLMVVPIFAIYVLDRFREHALASKNPFLIPLILFDQTLFDHSLIQSSMNQARLPPPCLS